MNVKPDFSKGVNHAQTAPAFLSIWDLHAYYGESYIVQGISFNVHEGEILALLGRNGAGKTSTLRSIARLLNCLLLVSYFLSPTSCHHLEPVFSLPGERLRSRLSLPEQHH